MDKFLLSTDTSCDEFKSVMKEKRVSYIPLTYSVDGVTHDDDFDSNEEYAAFYAMLKDKKMPTTSQITAFTHEEYFNSLIEGGAKNIIHLTLSSGLSNTYNSAVMGAADSMKKYPDAKIYVVDSLSATQGQCFVMDEGIRLRDEGVDAEEAARRLYETAGNVHHWFFADDLFHLHRGGRVSAASAIIGSVLKIKPVLIINNEGKLAVVHKAKGVRNALKYFTEQYEKYAEKLDGDVYLPQGDNFELAEAFKAELIEKYGCNVKIGWVGPIIGAHTGGGMLGFVFKGKGRLSNK
ncbi:MAG: DegV family protein [Clostridia bacterium]|jgi:DegV family protein with EDD domain|nr:DegV family protein [Clostridia bacterium]